MESDDIYSHTTIVLCINDIKCNVVLRRIINKDKCWKLIKSMYRDWVSINKCATELKKHSIQIPNLIPEIIYCLTNNCSLVINVTPNQPCKKDIKSIFNENPTETHVYMNGFIYQKTKNIKCISKPKKIMPFNIYNETTGKSIQLKYSLNTPDITSFGLYSYWDELVFMYISDKDIYSIFELGEIRIDEFLGKKNHKTISIYDKFIRPLYLQPNIKGVL